MQFVVDSSSAEPLFTQVTAQVRDAILTGTLGAGERLPSAKELASSLDINQHTVLRAYQDLRDEGFIELRRGRGAVVAKDHPRPDPALLDAIDHVRRKAAAGGIPLNTVVHLLTTRESS